MDQLDRLEMFYDLYNTQGIQDVASLLPVTVFSLALTTDSTAEISTSAPEVD